MTITYGMKVQKRLIGISAMGFVLMLGSIANANSCDCSRIVTSCSANIDVKSAQTTRGFNTSEGTEALSNWESIVTLSFYLPSSSNAAYMKNQCLQFDMTGAAGTFRFSETLTGGNLHISSRTVYGTKPLSKDDFQLNQCGICWDDAGEERREGMERVRSEEAAAEERAALEAEFENETLVDPDLDLSKFTSEELEEIRDNTDPWNYGDELRNRQSNDDYEDYEDGTIDNSISETPNIAEGEPDTSQTPPKSAPSNSDPEDPPITNVHTPPAISQGEPTYSGDGDTYWSKEQQDKVVIPEGFFDPDNPYGDQGPERPVEPTDPFAQFMNKMREGRNELGDIASDIRRKNRDYLDEDRERIESRANTVARARNYAEDRAKSQIDRIEQRSAAARPDLLGGGIYSPNTSSHEAQYQERCKQIVAPYQKRAQSLPSPESIAVGLQGLDACLSAIPSDSITYRQVSAQKLQIQDNLRSSRSQSTRGSGNVCPSGTSITNMGPGHICLLYTSPSPRDRG